MLPNDTFFCFIVIIMIKKKSLHIVITLICLHYGNDNEIFLNIKSYFTLCFGNN